MKEYKNEKEILEALERQAFLIDQKLDDDLSIVNELNSQLYKGDVGISINIGLSDPNTMLPTYLYYKYLENAGMSLDEFLENPADKVLLYPGDFEKGVAIVTRQLLQNKVGNTSFIQRIFELSKKNYTGYYTLTRLVRGKDKLVNIYVPTSHVGFGTNKMIRLLEETDYMRHNYHKFASLTAREKEIITLLALGYQNNEIAEQLFISKATVEQHRKNLKRKLEIKRFVDLIRFAQAFDLI